MAFNWRERHWGSVHNIWEDIGFGGPDLLRIAFERPSTLGYDESKVDTEACNGLVCANVQIIGDDETPDIPVVMTHFLRPAEGGSILRLKQMEHILDELAEESGTKIEDTDLSDALKERLLGAKYDLIGWAYSLDLENEHSDGNRRQKWETYGTKIEAMDRQIRKWHRDSLQLSCEKSVKPGSALLCCINQNVIIFLCNQIILFT